MYIISLFFFISIQLTKFVVIFSSNSIKGLYGFIVIPALQKQISPQYCGVNSGISKYKLHYQSKPRILSKRITNGKCNSILDETDTVNEEDQGNIEYDVYDNEKNDNLKRRKGPTRAFQRVYQKTGRARDYPPAPLNDREVMEQFLRTKADSANLRHDLPDLNIDRDEGIDDAGFERNEEEYVVQDNSDPIHKIMNNDEEEQQQMERDLKKIEENEELLENNNLEEDVEEDSDEYIKKINREESDKNFEPVFIDFPSNLVEDKSISTDFIDLDNLGLPDNYFDHNEDEINDEKQPGKYLYVPKKYLPSEYHDPEKMIKEKGNVYKPFKDNDENILDCGDLDGMDDPLDAGWRLKTENIIGETVNAQGYEIDSITWSFSWLTIRVKKKGDQSKHPDVPLTECEHLYNCIENDLDLHEKELLVLDRHHLAVGPPPKDEKLLVSIKQFNMYKGHEIEVKTGIADKEFIEYRRTLRGILIERDQLNLKILKDDNEVIIPHQFVIWARLADPEKHQSTKMKRN